MLRYREECRWMATLCGWIYSWSPRSRHSRRSATRLPSSRPDEAAAASSPLQQQGREMEIEERGGKCLPWLSCLFCRQVQSLAHEMRTLAAMRLSWRSLEGMVIVFLLVCRVVVGCLVTNRIFNWSDKRRTGPLGPCACHMWLLTVLLHFHTTVPVIILVYLV